MTPHRESIMFRFRNKRNRGMLPPEKYMVTIINTVRSFRPGMPLREMAKAYSVDAVMENIVPTTVTMIEFLYPTCMEPSLSTWI